ncbi:mechanosensitive ion channel family protein [Noviherbaspirillum sp. UKPF54]|uniref:mechanosensitive ion channel family protein n=1 Tax=Noviherbaspirillum sp. UKPF54 TaxID=2601898 RepID=UPI0011B0FF00|nr:mechanosensitive ion channel family protein [Noviherbaspirillum sp. UKPF54]QDZ27174.1 mechanosensitive ion channel family protein [Noviherbaspirillum sp. UKPF54]
MNSTYPLFGILAAFAQTELGRIIATVVSISIAAILLRVSQKRLRLGSSTMLDVEHRRGNLVLARNLIIGLTLVAVGSIWATKIAGAALSLAAVAGAVLIVSKEFLANVLGSAMLAISRPYRVGDFIEMGDATGRVLDTDLMVTTIAETLEGHQLTGRTAVLPNSLLLVRPVKNLTATGAYVINLLNIAADPDDDLLAMEKALLRAARDVCAPWLGDADRHLKQLESRDLVDLPSAEPRVLLQLHSAREYTLALRYCCRPNDRVKVEQAILRAFLKYRGALPASASRDKRMLAEAA